MITNHPSEATLLAHAAGTLPSPHRTVVRTHLAMCPTCGAHANLAAEAHGAMLLSEGPAAMSSGALDRVLSQLDLQDAERKPAKVPTTVEAFATGRWLWLGPGIRLMPLTSRDRQDARLDLIRVSPGARMPTHGHTGDELTCVLKGAFDDKTGSYGVGDIAEGDTTVEHRPSAIGDEDCICLIATRGRTLPRNFIARMMRPLVGL